MSRQSETFTMDWQGIALSVTHTPNYCGSHINHLAFQTHDRAPLPITETGYFSHFFNDHIGGYGGPVIYALMLLDAAAELPQWKERQKATQQLRLF